VPPLRREQFSALAERANAPSSGFSVKVKTGEEPTTGIMVSQPGSERKVSIPTTAEALEDYTKTFHGALHGPGAHFGFWHEDNGPEGDADVSRRFPEREHRRATEEMLMNKQRAMYHVSSGKDIYNSIHPGNAGKPGSGAHIAGLTPEGQRLHEHALGHAMDLYTEGLRKKMGKPSFEEESRQLREA
jgi:hypothetical protein